MPIPLEHIIPQGKIVHVPSAIKIVPAEMIRSSRDVARLPLLRSSIVTSTNKSVRARKMHNFVGKASALLPCPLWVRSGHRACGKFNIRSLTDCKESGAEISSMREPRKMTSRSSPGTDRLSGSTSMDRKLGSSIRRTGGESQRRVLCCHGPRYHHAPAHQTGALVSATHWFLTSRLCLRTT